MNRRPLYKHHYQQRSSGRGLIGLLAFVVMVGMTSLYLWHANSIATESFSLKSMEYERADLQSQINRLNVQIANGKSLHEVEKVIERRAMVAVQNPLFLNSDSEVAINF